MFVENVGNMACPSDYDLGEHGPGGHAQPARRGRQGGQVTRACSRAADVVLLNKIDLASVLPFNEDLLRQDLSRLNTRAPLLRLSAVGGQGLEAWWAWLRSCRSQAVQSKATA